MRSNTMSSVPTIGGPPHRFGRYARTCVVATVAAAMAFTAFATVPPTRMSSPHGRTRSSARVR